MLALIATSVRDMERLFDNWRTPLIVMAVLGFTIGVIGHLVSSRTASVTGILLVCVALVVFPVVLYVRGAP